HGGLALVLGRAAAADGAVVVVRVTEADRVADLMGDDVLGHTGAVRIRPAPDGDRPVGHPTRGEAGGAAGGAGLDRRGDGRAAASGRPAREGELQPQAVVVVD